jgi:glycosyltransferase involved in cell wall biosynthesis
MLIMRNPHLVSVIIPCYNQARFLGEAIQSVFAQTYRHYEIIVVDDGSSDETAEVAASFERVRCLSQKNRGLAPSRNVGLSVSEGGYLVFLDADDRLLPNALEDGLSALGSNPECMFAYGHVRLIASDGSPLPSPRQAAIRADHYLELLRHNYIWTTGTVVYRREVFDSVAGFNALVSGSADFDLNARISRLFPVCCTDRVVLEYRQHDESMSRDFARMLKAAVTARRLQRKFVKGNREYEEALQAGIRVAQEDYGGKLIGQVRQLCRKRRWGKAMAATLTLFRYYPRGFVRRAFRKLDRPGFNLQN